MEVMLMIGPRAGEIRDVHPFYAQQMLKDGRALDPNAPIVPEVAQPMLLPEVPRVAAAKRARGNK